MRNSSLHFKYEMITSLICVGIFVAPAAYAADKVKNDKEKFLDEIIVVSAKRSSPLAHLDGYIGITGTEEISSRNITSIDELGTVVGGLTFHQRGSSVYDNITLRGQPSPDFYDSKVQVYVDGFVQDQGSFGQALPEGYERVEVLYGPQGSLYGRGAIGGVINIVKEKPDNDFHVKLKGGYGSRKKDVSALVGGALVEDVLYFDVAGGYRNQQGLYKEQSTNEDFGDSENTYGRARLRYAPVDGPLDIMLTAGRSKIDSDEEQYVHELQLEERIAFPVLNEFELTHDYFTATINYDLELGVLTSQTGYQDRTLDRTVFSSASDEEQSTLTQELRFASSGESDDIFSYVLGLYYEDYDFTFTRFGLKSENRFKSYAVFGELTWRVADKIDLTTGGRINWYDVNSTGTAGSLQASDSEKFTSISPKVILGYQLNDNARLYALYSTGYKAGGFTRLVTPGSAGFEYDPEKARNFEIGFRSSFWDNKIDLALSAYHTINDDYQFFVGPQPFQYLQNIGDARSQGVDLNIKAKPAEGLLLNFAIAANDGEFTRYENPFAPGQDFTGNKLPFSPRLTANFDISYDIALPEGYGILTPGIGMNYRSKSYFNEENTLFQNSYILLDANLRWALNDHFMVDLYASNIGNESYLVYGFMMSDGNFYQVAPKREGGMRLSVMF